MTLNRDKLPAYAKRVLELADHDPQLQELMPDPAVEDALREPGSSLEQVIATMLDGYADRPALGERAYEIVVDRPTGRRRREYAPRFDTITYYELHSRVKDLASTCGMTSNIGSRLATSSASWDSAAPIT